MRSLGTCRLMAIAKPSKRVSKFWTLSGWAEVEHGGDELLSEGKEVPGCSWGISHRLRHGTDTPQSASLGGGPMDVQRHNAV